MARHFGLLYDGHAEKDHLYTLKRVKAAGFSSLELSFGTASPRSVCEAAEAAGLRIEAARLPSDGANLLWDGMRTWNNLRAFYKTYFSLAASHGIDTLIFTPSTGKNPPPVTQWGLERLEILSEDATQAGVRLSVENDADKRHFEAAVRILCRGDHDVSFRIHSAMENYGTAVPPDYAAPHVTRVVLEEDRESYGRPLFGRTDLLAAADKLLRQGSVSALLVRQEWEEGVSPEAYAARAYDTAYRFEQTLRNGEARL